MHGAAGGAGTTYRWRRLSDCAYHGRLPFCDVSVGLVAGSDAALLIDCGSTLSEARGIAADIAMLTDRPIRHLVLTHAHFDHVLGAAAFDTAAVHAAPRLAELLATGRDGLRADAVHHGADAGEVDAALAVLRGPDHLTLAAELDLGDVVVRVTHPGRGHTDHDLVVLVPPTGPADRPVLFCGDLIEQSADPAIGDDTDLDAWPATLERLLALGGPDACYVPGHGAPVDAGFVRAQREWLTGRRR